MDAIKPKRSQNLRTFYTLVLTQTFSLIGSRISGLAISIWLYADTQNATPLAMVAFFMALPMVLASSFSGVLADRWDRRYVMVLADAGQAVGTVLLFISFASGHFALWHLYTVAFIQAIFGIFQMPAFSASVTMLIPDEKRDRANAIQQLAGPISGIIAPALAAMVYAAVDVEGAILVDLGTFLVAIAVVFSVHIPRPKQTKEGKELQGSVWSEALSGLRYLAQRKPMLFIVIYAALLNFLLNGVMILGTPYILARTDQNEIILGTILSVMNVGAIAGGIILSIWGGTRPRMYTILPCILVSGLFLALFGASRAPVAMGFTLLMFMLPLPIVDALFMSIVQVKIPPDIQGRVFATIMQLIKLLTPAAYLMVGPLADNVFEPAVGTSGWSTVAPLVGDGAGAGMGLMMLVSGIGIVIVTLAAVATRSLRDMEKILPDFEAEALEEGADAGDDYLQPEPAPVS